MHLAGESLSSLQFGSSPDDRVTVELLLGPLKEKCLALRRLDVRALCIRHCAPSVHGSRLRSIHAVAPKQFHNLLCAVGRNLEEMEISFGWKPHDIKQVRSHCPNLTHISFVAGRRGTTDDREAHAELLCSHGAQLKFARVETLPLAVCQQVLTACPNIRCGYVKGKPNIEKLSVSGSSLKNLVWRMKENDVSDPRLVSAARSWSELESIEVFPPFCWTIEKTVSVIELLLNGEKPRLSSLSLKVSAILDGAEVLQALGAPVEKLRAFSFHCTLGKTGAFDSVARDTPLLENVTIFLSSVKRYGAVLELFMEDIVRSFIRCPNLMTLDIIGDDYKHYNEEHVRFDSEVNLCFRRRLRKKNPVFIRVLGEVYLG